MNYLLHSSFGRACMGLNVLRSMPPGHVCHPDPEIRAMAYRVLGWPEVPCEPAGECMGIMTQAKGWPALYQPQRGGAHRAAGAIAGARARGWPAPRLAALAGDRAGPVLLHPGTGTYSPRLDKHWPWERWHALGGLLAAEVRQAVLIPGFREVARFPDELRAWRDAGLHMAGLGKLELLDMMRRASCLIACDSGPAHLAASVGLPVVVLFGPTCPADWQPTGPAVTVLHRLGMSHEPADVLAGAKAYLSPRPGSPVDLGGSDPLTRWPATGPSLASRVVAGVAGAVKAVLPQTRAPAAVASQRLAVCLTCELLTACGPAQCCGRLLTGATAAGRRGCGCIVRLKTKVACECCPVGKWGAVAAGQP